MDLDRSRGPDEGSMTVVFACPDCGRETAMLTNAMETQVVRSLGVSIGGRGDAPAPMETVRGQLRDAAESDGEDDDSEESARGRGDGHPHASPHPSTEASAQEDAAGARDAESRCPFTGTVEEAFAETEREDDERAAREEAEDDGHESASPGSQSSGSDQPVWTEAAEERLDRIPAMARSFARTGIEEYAREEGIDRIDEQVMDAVKGRFSL